MNKLAPHPGLYGMTRTCCPSWCTAGRDGHTVDRPGPLVTVIEHASGHLGGEGLGVLVELRRAVYFNLDGRLGSIRDSVSFGVEEIAIEDFPAFASAIDRVSASLRSATTRPLDDGEKR